MFRPDFRTVVPLCELYPGFSESCIVVFETRERIIFEEVILLELLNDNQNEELEHNIADNEDEPKEKEGGNVTSARLARYAVRPRSHTVVHDSIPVLARRYREEQGKALMEVAEVFVLTDDISLSHLCKHRVA